MPKPNATLAAFTFDLDASGAAKVPDAIMLIPAGTIMTEDGRGPYHVQDAQKVIAASMQDGVQLPIDENHATDRAGVVGNQAPARGWITSMEAREDGIWGTVDWTKDGQAMIADRAYRYLSPVITHDKQRNILSIARASLTNNPNLRGMVALNTKGADMDFMGKLRKALGLADDADEDAVLAAIGKMADKPDEKKALQSALGPIAQAAGLEEGADATAILGRVETMRENAEAAGKQGNDEVITSLQTQLATTTEELKTLKGDRAKEKAVAFVDAAIAEGRVGVKPLRDHYIERHTKEPNEVEKEIAAFAKVDPDMDIIPPTPPENGGVALQSAERDVCVALGIPEDDFKKTRDAQQAA